MKRSLLLIFICGWSLTSDNCIFKNIPVRIYNDTTLYGFQVTYDGKRYEIPPIKEFYQLSGIEVPFTFVKNEKNILSTFSAIAYQLQEGNKEYVQSSDIAIDLQIATSNKTQDWKNILAQLYLIKLHYSSELDWRMQYVGSPNANFSFNHLKSHN